MCFSALWHFRVKVGNNCVVCAEAILIGNITIGDGTTIHPRAQIIAEAGPIIIGENNLIEENACIVNRHVGNPLVIGNDNVFEIGSRCEASKVGDGNVIEMKAVFVSVTNIDWGCSVGCRTQNREVPGSSPG
ncbi:unnamed protein product [Soboliphyme baturini]|uniref:Dynactin subunit 6 n=1 Tax=Soboliphyme baturini TaxID=241478 RepID=A0A183IY11_9BILA|nr:unnamed protein product [Soboliphyme baturini]